MESNDIDYYFEIHGAGKPLLLLHGGLGTIDMFTPILPALAAGRQVIAVELHGHGRTSLGNRPMTAVDMGDDMAHILAVLGHERVDVLGYSLGAAVALRLAVQHPQRVRRLVLVSGAFARDGFYPEMLQMQEVVGSDMGRSMKDSPMYRSYVAVARDPEDFPKLLDRLGVYMRQPYDWSDDVRKLSLPLMLVYGDSDMFRPEHIVSFYKLLGGGLRDPGWTREKMSPNRLAILPGLTHYDIFQSPALVSTVIPFLDGPCQSGSWELADEGG